MLKNSEKNFLLLLPLIVIIILVNLPYADGITIEVRDEEGNLGAVLGTPLTAEPFELGSEAIPLLTINIILFSCVGPLYYYKNQIPTTLKRLINFLLNFDVSRKIALLTIVMLLSTYVLLTVPELFYEEQLGDYKGVKEGAKNLRLDLRIGAGLKYILLSISLNTFGNIRIIPFIVSICLLLLTYLFVTALSKKRFGGLVAITILLQSSLFLKYDTTATQTNIWTLFYLLSLYLMYKRWYLSSLSFIASLFSKPFVVIFIPMTLFFIYRSNIPKKKKIHIVISYVIITGIIIIAISTGFAPVDYNSISINLSTFLSGFTFSALNLRYESLLLFFLLPLITGLFMLSRIGSIQSECAMIFIMVTILSFPMLAIFTDIANQPYRAIPLVVFFAIGVGTLFSKSNSLPMQKRSRLLSYTIFLITVVVALLFLTSIVFPALIPSIIQYV